MSSDEEATLEQTVGDDDDQAIKIPLSPKKADVTEKKRGRGRPKRVNGSPTPKEVGATEKKRPKNASGSPSPKKVGATEQKRGRGRPRKLNRSTTPKKSGGPKRGRGRPKKE